MTLRDFQRDFNKNFIQNFNRVADFVEGFLTDLARQVDSPKTKQALNSALDLVRPHFISMGVRISKLSGHQIEMTIPTKVRNLDEQGHLLEGVQTSVAIEAFKLMWKRNVPTGQLEIKIQSVQSRFFHACETELFMRGEISELQREVSWAELVKTKKTQQSLTFKAFAANEQLVSEFEIEADFILQEMLEWK